MTHDYFKTAYGEGKRIAHFLIINVVSEKIETLSIQHQVEISQGWANECPDLLPCEGRGRGPGAATAWGSSPHARRTCFWLQLLPQVTKPSMWRQGSNSKEGVVEHAPGFQMNDYKKVVGKNSNIYPVEGQNDSIMDSKEESNYLRLKQE